MMEIEFIPLKTPDGQTAGHARVQGGYVDVRLRNRHGGQALVLTDGGHVSGNPDTRMHAGGRVTAVAVHAAGALSCVGFARAGIPALSEHRRRIAELVAEPAEKPAMERPARQAPVIDTPPSEPAREPIAHISAPDASAQASETEVVPMRRSARHVPAGEDVKRTLDRLAQPGDAAFFAPETPEKQEAPRILPAITDDGDDGRADAFAALLARADAVFRRIADPFDGEDTPPLPFRAPTDDALTEQAKHTVHAPEPVLQTARAQEPAPASRDLGAWSRAVDDILADMPAPAVHDIENPFPHIFPGARFVHRGNLFGSETFSGEWERGGEEFTVTAVRGDYSPQPPERLPGFTRYIRTLLGGFWVRVEEGGGNGHFSFAKEK